MGRDGVRKAGGLGDLGGEGKRRNSAFGHFGPSLVQC